MCHLKGVGSKRCAALRVSAVTARYPLVERAGIFGLRNGDVIRKAITGICRSGHSEIVAARYVPCIKAVGQRVSCPTEIVGWCDVRIIVVLGVGDCHRSCSWISLVPPQHNAK